MVDPARLYRIVEVFNKLLSGTSFGGKDKGKFTIQFDRLSKISGIAFFTPTILSELVEIAYHNEIILCQIPGGLAVFDLKIALLARKVPLHIAEKFEYNINSDPFL